MDNTAADDSMIHAVTTAVTDAILKRDRELSEKLRQAANNSLDLERTAKRFTNIKETIVALGFFGTLIGGGALAVNEIQNKPSEAEMYEAIDNKVDPVIETVTPMQETVEQIDTDLDRVQQVQAIQLEQADWRAFVADCRADKKCKKDLSEPKTLKDKKRELITK